MCNLYSITRSQDAMRQLFAVAHDQTGNLPPLPGVFPDYPAPIVRMARGERELTMMRWGMPGPPQFGGAPITNIRNTASPHWRRWLGPASRCLVPVTSFCEYADTKPKKTPTWFALDDEPAAVCLRRDLDTVARRRAGPRRTRSRASTCSMASSPRTRTASSARCTPRPCR